jgi:hypothetical protein
MNDDIVTIALTINGTEGVQPTLTEPAHLVTFVGASCARTVAQRSSLKLERIPITHIGCSGNRVLRHRFRGRGHE